MACYGGTDVMERSCAVARGKDINIVAGFELPVADHPRPDVHVLVLNAGAHYELVVVVVVGPQTAPAAPPESGHSTAVPKKAPLEPPFGSGGTEGHLKRPLWRAPFSGLFSRLSGAINSRRRPLQ